MLGIQIYKMTINTCGDMMCCNVTFSKILHKLCTCIINHNRGMSQFLLYEDGESLINLMYLWNNSSFTPNIRHRLFSGFIKYSIHHFEVLNCLNTLFRLQLNFQEQYLKLCGWWYFFQKEQRIF